MFTDRTDAFLLTPMQTIYLTAQLQKWDSIIWHKMILASLFPIHSLHSSGFYLLHSQNLCIHYFYPLTTVYFVLRQTSERSLSTCRSRKPFLQCLLGWVQDLNETALRDTKKSKLIRTTENISAKGQRKIALTEPKV